MTPLTRRFRFGSFEPGATVRRRIRRIAVAGMLCSTTLVLPACTDNPNGPEDPRPSPPQVLAEGPFTLDAPTEDSYHFGLVPNITNSVLGQWEATVNWTFDTNTLWMWVAEGTCTVAQFQLPECPLEAACPCQFVVRSQTAAPKPRLLSIANARGGTRTLIIANLGPREESGNFRVTLQPSSLLASEDLAVLGMNAGGAMPETTYGRKTNLRR